MQPVTVYWCRRDMRTRDNPALYHAIKESKAKNTVFLPLFIVENYMKGDNPKYQFGAPSRYAITYLLADFVRQFPRFSIMEGRAAEELIRLNTKIPLNIHVNEDIYPDFYKQIRKLKKHGMSVTMYSDALSIPRNAQTQTGKYYSVYTPFRNAVWEEFLSSTETPQATWDDLQFFEHYIDVGLSEEVSHDRIAGFFSDIEALRLTDGTTLSLPKRTRIYTAFTEEEGLQRFTDYIETSLEDYGTKRSNLDTMGIVSRMSMPLAWGAVSARTLKNMILARFPKPPYGPYRYLKELLWREFYRYILLHDMELLDKEFQEKKRGIPWLYGDEGIRRFTAWMEGRTGYTLVDAAMHELNTTGYMHNRTRMLVSSVLTKNLGVDWRWGQEYFRAMLIDIDESSNNGGWQWGASVGADPKPIRIFNPYLQAERFDPDGVYQKRFLPKEYWDNPPPVLVEHTTARADALARYKLSEQISIESEPKVLR